MRRLAASACALLLATGAGAAPAGQEEEAERPFWIPDAAQIQHAGNLGWIALGPAWAWWERRIHLALLFSWVPPFAGGTLTGVAGKVSIWPMELELDDQFFVRPLELGAVVHYTFGESYFIRQPDRYPASYYDYSTAVRVGLLAGASVGIARDLWIVDRSELYLEVGTTDLELYLHLRNPETRPLTDALHLAAGVLLWF